MASASAARPLRLAVVGSGPSGFYAAARVLAAFKDGGGTHRDVQVHMYERLPVPNGLVRWGVAPDHLDVKNVENKFAEVASDPRFAFFGNVNVVAAGCDAANTAGSAGPQGYDYPHAVKVPISHLQENYTHLLLSYGCSESRALGIPGSQPGQLHNVHSALDFVNWYNGHPAAHDPDVIAREPWRKVDLQGLRQMSVIGAGNVALDVARIVLRASTGSLFDAAPSPSSLGSSQARRDLETSDIPEPVLQHLYESRIANVDINARRGPAQAAFTNKELREMMALPGVAFQDVDKEMIRRAEQDVEREEQEARVTASKESADEAAKELAANSAGQARIKKRLLSLLAKGSKVSAAEADKSWALNFFRAPSAFVGGAESSRLQTIKWTATSLGPGSSAVPAATNAAEGNSPVWGNEPSSRSAATQVEGAATIPTGSDRPTPRVPLSEFETPADLVVSSVGYKGQALPGSSSSRSSSTSRAGDVQPTNASDTPPTISWDSAKGVVPNRHGRVLNPATDSLVSVALPRCVQASSADMCGSRLLASLDSLSHHTQSPSTTQIPNTYVSGWLSRGPVGVIASTMYDAYSVADLILEDYHRGDSNAPLPSWWHPRLAAQAAGGSGSGSGPGSGSASARPGSPVDHSPWEKSLEPYRGDRKIVQWQDWLRLDEHERRMGSQLGKQREKVLSVSEMLRIMS
ncbi:unnamed protein product [Parajaminaea phylloscopi]